MMEDTVSEGLIEKNKWAPRFLLVLVTVCFLVFLTLFFALLQYWATGNSRAVIAAQYTVSMLSPFQKKQSFISIYLQDVLHVFPEEFVVKVYDNPLMRQNSVSLEMYIDSGAPVKGMNKVKNILWGHKNAMQVDVREASSILRIEELYSSILQDADRAKMTPSSFAENMFTLPSQKNSRIKYIVASYKEKPIAFICRDFLISASRCRGVFSINNNIISFYFYQQHLAQYEEMLALIEQIIAQGERLATASK